MLSQNQIDEVWKRQLAAEVRSLYFGELASKYARIKQVITFITFFSSSGAVVSVLSKTPPWVPLALSVLIATLTAYTIAYELDPKTRSMAKLHSSWNELGMSYQRLWDNVHSDESQLTFESLTRRERDLGETSTTEAPNDQKRLAYWQDYVHKQHHLVNA